MSAILTFLGGSAFRAIWGEVSAWFTKRQDHKLELERLQVQAQLDAAAHAREQQAIVTQHQMGVETIRIQSDASIEQSAAEAFREAMARAATPTGIAWVDGWNGSIRPAYATIALALWVLALYRAGWVPTEWDKELMAIVAGFYFADRTLRRKGK